ncbi:hypothetical protein HDU99_000220 [Rhizoclosmatium hyalinum]|nr:hypothetical protein HDU99_000220 [Rhizoclosmatium hyalinum]
MYFQNQRKLKTYEQMPAWRLPTPQPDWISTSEAYYNANNCTLSTASYAFAVRRQEPSTLTNNTCVTSTYSNPDAVISVLKGAKTIPEVLKDIQATGKDFALYTKYNTTSCTGEATELYAYALDTAVIQGNPNFDGSPYDYKFSNKEGKIQMSYWVGEKQTTDPVEYTVDKCSSERSSKWTLLSKGIAAAGPTETKPAVPAAVGSVTTVKTSGVCAAVMGFFFSLISLMALASETQAKACKTFDLPVPSIIVNLPDGMEDPTKQPAWIFTSEIHYTDSCSSVASAYALAVRPRPPTTSENTTCIADYHASFGSFQYGTKSITDITKDIQSTGKDFAVFSKYNTSTCTGDATELYAYTFDTVFDQPSFDGAPYDHKISNAGSGKIKLSFWVGTQEMVPAADLEVGKCLSDPDYPIVSSKWTIVGKGDGSSVTKPAITVTTATSVKTSGGFAVAAGVATIIISFFVL